MNLCSNRLLHYLFWLARLATRPSVYACCIMGMLAPSLYAQDATKVWDKTFGGSSYDSLTVAINERAVSLGYGNYLLAGTSASGPTGDKSQHSRGKKDYWMVGLTNSGTKGFDRRFGTTSDDILTCAIKTSDGGYLLGGYTDAGINGDKTQPGRGETDYWIIKINASGFLEWDKSFGGTEDDRLFALIPTADGGYLLGGVSNSEAGGDKTDNSLVGEDEPFRDWYDFWVIKIDSQGQKQWDNTVGSYYSDIYFASLLTTSDGGYLVSGSRFWLACEGCEQDLNSYALVKLSGNGEQQWAKFYGGGGDDILKSVAATSDGGYLLAGSSGSAVSSSKSQPSIGSNGDYNPMDYWIIKVDSTGTRQWDYVYGTAGDDDLRSMVPTRDGGYYLAGSSNGGADYDKTEESKGGTDYWLVKISAAGIKEWDKSFGSSSDDHLSTLLLTPDSDTGYLLAGTSSASISGDKSENSRGLSDFWVVKTFSALPGVPTEFRSEVASRTEVYLYWSIGNGDAKACSDTINPVNFVVERSLQSNGPFSVIHMGKNCMGTYVAFSDTTLSPNTRYYYRVKAINPSGSSGYSQVISATTHPEVTSPPNATKEWDKTSLPSKIAIGGLDGGYLLASDTMVVKTDLQGNILWQHTYDLSIKSVITTWDGNYLLSGSTDTYGYYIVKINRTGTPIWNKGYTGGILQKVIQTSDGGYLLGGTSSEGIGEDKTSPSRGLQDYWVLKVDGSGAKQWDKTFGGSEQDMLSSIIQTGEGGYLLAGTSFSGSSGDKTEESRDMQDWYNYSGQRGDYWVIKTDNNGHKQWDKRYGGASEDKLVEIVETADGGYVLAGSSHSLEDPEGSKFSTNTYFYEFGGVQAGVNVCYWILKIDNSGTRAWDKTFCGAGTSYSYDAHSYLTAMVETVEGGFLLGGFSAANLSSDKSEGSRLTSNLSFIDEFLHYIPDYSHDYWIIKVKQDGTKQWDKTFGGFGEDSLQAVLYNADGSILLAGRSTSGADGDKSQAATGSWIIKTHALGLPAALQINFQDKYTRTPPGWKKDYGLPFGDQLLADSLYTFGWKNKTDGTPIDLSVGGSFSGNGRWRPAPADPLLATLMHMQGNDVKNFRGMPVESYWELAVENGEYQVTVSVGDGLRYTGTDIESHSINVEGMPAITQFTPTGANGSMNRFKQATLQVSVTDGLLTIDSEGGTNTKINYAIIQPLGISSGKPSARISSQQTLITQPQISAYPNPFTDKLMVETSLRGKVTIRLYDIMGRIYHQADYSPASGAVPLDLSSLSLEAGIYLIKLQEEDGTDHLIRVIKK